MSQLTGLFFGSFNPIHVGHLMIASQIRDLANLREVWFVISPQNPFKKKTSLLDEKLRYYMVSLAVEDDYNLRANNIEFGLPQPSYTVNTVTHLTEKYPEREWALIMGSDNLNSFHKWKNYEALLKQCQLLIYPRPEYPVSKGWLGHEKVQIFDVPHMRLSASLIRDRISKGQSIRYLVTEPVRQYIDEMNLYL